MGSLIKKKDMLVADKTCDAMSDLFEFDRDTSESSESGASDPLYIEKGIDLEILQSMLEKLTDEEKEAAARVNFEFERYADTSSSKDAVYVKKRDDAVAMMLRRYYISAEGEEEVALRRIRSTLRKRDKLQVNLLRRCFENETAQMKEWQRLIRKYNGPDGRLFVRGYDNEGRACAHIIFKSTPAHVKHDPEGYLEAHIYMIERVIACTERHNNQTRGDFVMCLDFDGFRTWHLTVAMIKFLMGLLIYYHPERLHRAYILDAPLIFRLLFKVVAPLASAHIIEKWQFVTKKEQMKVMSGLFKPSEAMPYQRPDGELTDPVDIEKFYRLPFGQAYDEN